MCFLGTIVVIEQYLWGTRRLYRLDVLLVVREIAKLF